MLDEKESSDDISSDGEFLDASRIELYHEDDSYINDIEDKKKRR
jgi:hypothetical protein